MVRKGFISLVFFLLVLAVWSSYMEGYQKTQRAQKTSEEAVKNCVSTLRNRVSARLDKILGSADIYLHNTVSGNYLQLSPLPEYYQGADVDPDVYWLHVTLRLHVQVEVLLPDENKSKSMDIDLYEVYSKSFNKFAEPLIISSCKGRYDTNVAFVSHRTSFLPFLSDAFAEEQKKGEDDGWQERITEEITKFAIKQAVKEVAGKLLGGVIGTIFDSKEIVSDEVEMAQLEAAKKKIAEEQARKRQMEAAADVLRREMFHNKALSGPKSSNNSSPNKPSSNKPPASRYHGPGRDVHTGEHERERAEKAAAKERAERAAHQFSHPDPPSHSDPPDPEPEAPDDFSDPDFDSEGPEVNWD